MVQELNFSQILDFYNHLFKLQAEYPCKAFITDDIYSLRLELCNSDDDRKIVESSKQTLKGFNGLLVQPDEIDEMFYILIKQNDSNNPNIYSKTFSHEYTHVSDYFEFKERNNILNMRKNEVYSDFEFFQFYSEIRARFRGSLIFYQLVNVENNVLIKEYNDYLVPAYKDKVTPSFIFPDNYQRMYMLAQFYGQFLAISCKTNSVLTLPGYIQNDKSMELLLEITSNIANKSIFENYDAIGELYVKCT